MTTTTERLTQLLRDYEDWTTHREALSEWEDNDGDEPEGGGWADNDDEAVQLLEEAIVILGAIYTGTPPPEGA